MQPTPQPTLTSETATAPDPRLCPICKKSHAGSDASTLKRLAETPVRLAVLLKGLDAKGFERSYGPGKWSIREIVCHLRDCELVYGLRWRKTVSEEDVQLMPFDQDFWATKTRYKKQDARQALATLALVRATNVEMLKLAGKEALARVGRHPEYGPLSVAQTVRHLLAHDENHLKQVATARESAPSKRPRGTKQVARKR